MMPIERMRPEDFDAVFRLLARSFPAGERRDKAGSARCLRTAPIRSTFCARRPAVCRR